MNTTDSINVFDYSHDFILFSYRLPGVNTRQLAPGESAGMEAARQMQDILDPELDKEGLFFDPTPGHLVKQIQDAAASKCEAQAADLRKLINANTTLSASEKAFRLDDIKRRLHLFSGRYPWVFLEGDTFFGKFFTTKVARGLSVLEAVFIREGFSQELHIGHGDAAERKVRTFYPHNASHDFSAHGLAIISMIARVVK